MKWSHLIIRLAIALISLVGMATTWSAVSPTAQASPVYQCAPPPPICTIDPRTGTMTCTKVCQSTPAPRSTPPPQNTPPSQNTPRPQGTPPSGNTAQPPGATNTPRPNGTAVFGTPVGTQVGTPAA